MLTRRNLLMGSLTAVPLVALATPVIAVSPTTLQSDVTLDGVTVHGCIQIPEGVTNVIIRNCTFIGDNNPLERTISNV